MLFIAIAALVSSIMVIGLKLVSTIWNDAAVYENLIIKIKDQVIYLNHFPYLCFDGTYRTNNIPWQLFGHVHLNSCKEKNTGKDFERLKFLFPNQYDVGVDFNNYRPISYLEVKEKIEYQMQNNINCLYWIK